MLHLEHQLISEATNYLDRQIQRLKTGNLTDQRVSIVLQKVSERIKSELRCVIGANKSFLLDNDNKKISNSASKESTNIDSSTSVKNSLFDNSTALSETSDDRLTRIT